MMDWFHWPGAVEVKIAFSAPLIGIRTVIEQVALIITLSLQHFRPVMSNHDAQCSMLYDYRPVPPDEFARSVSRTEIRRAPMRKSER